MYGQNNMYNQNNQYSNNNYNQSCLVENFHL